MNKKEGGAAKNTLQKLLLGFVYAGSGIKQLFKTERNIWVHTIAMLCTVVLGFIVNLSSTEWIAVILCCGLVLGAEAVNTAIEYLANYCTTDKNEQIRKVKDISAGAVLICAIAALFVGLIIFIPKILLLFDGG